MKISIVTPSYNQVEFLENALNSVRRQQGDFDLEHIVVDGGSTDGSVELLQKYNHFLQTDEFKPSCRSYIFRWWSRKDRGQSEAINKGFAASTGEIIGWLNSDDTYINSKSLSALLQPFHEDRADIVVGNGYHIDEEGNVLDIPCLVNKLDNSEFQQRLKTLARYNFILQPSSLFRRNVWESCAINEDFHYIMDWVFWLEAQRKGFQFYKISTFAATNRLHLGAKTVEGGIGKYQEGLELFKQNNIWCLNRFHYFLYLLLLKARIVPFLGSGISSVIRAGKIIRIQLINHFKQY